MYTRLCACACVCRYECGFPGCGKRYKHVQSKKEHEASHYTERQFLCTVPGCGRGFTSKTNRNRHSKTPHNADASGESV